MTGVKVGQVWRYKGTRRRVIVCDFTLGGSIVFIEYRLRNSIRKTYSCNQIVFDASKFLELYELTTEVL